MAIFRSYVKFPEGIQTWYKVAESGPYVTGV